MAEEHRFQAPEGHRLCANNCGFAGSPATMNLCSQCFRDLSIKKSTAATAATAALEVPLSLPPSVSSSSSSSSSSPSVSLSLLPEAESRSPAEESCGGGVVSVPRPAAANRCSSCRKRVGLTGFKCRCGITFCGAHRYPEKHGCGFDFKGMGREEIAKANPLVKADKLPNKI